MAFSDRVCFEPFERKTNYFGSEWSFLSFFILSVNMKNIRHSFRKKHACGLAILTCVLKTDSHVAQASLELTFIAKARLELLILLLPPPQC